MAHLILQYLWIYALLVFVRDLYKDKNDFVHYVVVSMNYDFFNFQRTFDTLI